MPRLLVKRQFLLPTAASVVVGNSRARDKRERKGILKKYTFVTFSSELFSKEIFDVTSFIDLIEILSSNVIFLCVVFHSHGVREQGEIILLNIYYEMMVIDGLLMVTFFFIFMRDWNRYGDIVNLY